MSPFTKSRRNALIWIMILGLGAGLFWPLPTLVIRQPDSDHQLLIPLLQNKGFSLYFLHSVQKTPVKENYILAPGNKLRLISTDYQSYGVGLPFLPEEGVLINDDGIFRLTGINRLYDKIDMGFMPLADHALLYGSKRYEFDRYFDEGSLLQITVKGYSPFLLLWRMLEGGRM